MTDTDRLASHIATLTEFVAVILIIACGFVWVGIATGRI